MVSVQSNPVTSIWGGMVFYGKGYHHCDIIGSVACPIAVTCCDQDSGSIHSRFLWDSWLVWNILGIIYILHSSSIHLVCNTSRNCNE